MQRKRFRSFRHGGRQAGGGGGVCYGQEVPEQAHEGDIDQTAGVRVHQDAGLSRGGYFKGLKI